MKINISKSIGQQIKEEADRQGISADKLGEMIGCNRQNVYKIYAKTSLDTARLGSISRALHHDFFADIVANPFLSGVDDEEAQKEIYNKMAVAQFTEVAPKVLMKLGIEPVIFFGRPIGIPQDIPLPDYFIGPFNLTLTIGDLLFDKQNCNLGNTAKVARFTDERTGLSVDQWEFKNFGPNLIDLKLDYKTEEEWEAAFRFVFKHFYSKYNIIKE